MKAISISAVVGTITMFAWQSVSQTAIPWHAATMTNVSDSTAKSIATIRQLAPANGVYFSNYGLLMAVRIAPDNSDQTSPDKIAPMLMRQVGLDLVVVILFCLLAGLLIDQSPLGVAKAMAIAGFSMIGLQCSRWRIGTGSHRCGPRSKSPTRRSAIS